MSEAVNHPLGSRTQQTEAAAPPTSQPDITRPTLKRITNHSPASGKPPNNPPPSTATPSATSPRQAPLAQLNSLGGVLIHQVQQNQSLPGIALSYGISLSALRKANRMWTSDPLNIKTTLRIPLALCNLPPSKKIEIEQDSGKVIVFEPHSRSSQSSTSTIHSEQPFASSSTHPKTSTLDGAHHKSDYIHTDNCQSLLDLDYSSSRSNLSSCDSYQYPQLGQLAPISNTDSPPTNSDSIMTVASLEMDPSQEPIFFNSKSIPSNSNPSSSSRSLPPSLVIPDTLRTSSSTDRIHSSSNNLRQRSRPLPSSSRSNLSSSPPSKAVTNRSHQTSPDSKKKQNFNFFSSNHIPPLSPFLRPNFSNLLGNEETEGGGRTTGKSKWTTVRPGKPPPLGHALSFLEEPTTLSTNKIGQAVSNAIEGIFNPTSKNSNSTQKKKYHQQIERQKRAVDQVTPTGLSFHLDHIESHEIDEF